MKNDLRNPFFFCGFPESVADTAEDISVADVEDESGRTACGERYKQFSLRHGRTESFDTDFAVAGDLTTEKNQVAAQLYVTISNLKKIPQKNTPSNE